MERRHLVFIIGRVNFVKCHITPYQNPNGIFIEIEKTILNLDEMTKDPKWPKQL